MPIWLNDVLFGRMAQVTSAAKAAFLRELTITALKRCATQRPVARWRASLLRWQTWWPKKIPARGGSGASSSEYKLSQVSSLTGLDPFRRAFPALTCRAFLLRRCAAGFTWTVVPVALAPLRGWIRGRFLPVAVAPLRGWIYVDGCSCCACAPARLDTWPVSSCCGCAAARLDRWPVPSRCGCAPARLDT